MEALVQVPERSTLERLFTKERGPVKQPLHVRFRPGTRTFALLDPADETLALRRD
jgi:hypothetical protein